MLLQKIENNVKHEKKNHMDTSAKMNKKVLRGDCYSLQSTHFAYFTIFLIHETQEYFWQAEHFFEVLFPLHWATWQYLCLLLVAVMFQSSLLRSSESFDLLSLTILAFQYVEDKFGLTCRMESKRFTFWPEIYFHITQVLTSARSFMEVFAKSTLFTLYFNIYLFAINHVKNNTRTK